MHGFHSCTGCSGRVETVEPEEELDDFELLEEELDDEDELLDELDS